MEAPGYPLPDQEIPGSMESSPGADQCAAHNRRLLSKLSTVEVDNCNCKKKEEYPMQGYGPCNVGSVVYQAVVTSVVTSPNLSKPKNYVGSSTASRKDL